MVVYICSPYSGGVRKSSPQVGVVKRSPYKGEMKSSPKVEEIKNSPKVEEIKKNTERAKAYCRFAVDEGHVPIAPHLLFPQFLDEGSERELALQMDLILLERCDEIWIFGDVITSGMIAEIAYAGNKGIKARFFEEEK